MAVLIYKMKNKKVLLVFALLIVLNIFSWELFFSLRRGEMEVVFLDVGQGDAILIKTPQHHHILIDGGPGSTVLEKLGEEFPFFYNSLDLIILTHPHDDHVAGLIEVVKRYEVKDILCTGVREETGVSREWSRIIEEEGYRQARAGTRISANDFYIDILYPAENLAGKYVKDLNEVSVISRLVYKDSSFLFTGDAYKKQEREVIAFLQDCKEEDWCSIFTLDSDVLKLGHHGSRTSTSKEFLQYVSPSAAVVMAGEGNRYGHPHREILEKLEKYGITVKRTDVDGDIRIVSED